MRSRAIAAAAVFSISLAGVSQAADVNEQGAKDLRDALTHSLSRDLARSGFVTVTPGAGQYEITYDFERFFDKINSSVLSVTGLKPLTLMAQPLDHGQWGIKGDNTVDFSVVTPAANMKYSLASSSVDVILDPAVEVTRSMSAKYAGLRFSSIGTGPRTGQVIDLGVDNSTSTTAITDSTETGKVDLQARSALQGFNEKLTSPHLPTVTLTAGNIDSSLTATSLPAKELQGLVRFFIEHIKAKELSEAGKAKFAELVHRALPVFGSVGEAVTINDLAISTEKGKFGLKTLDYTLKMDGLTKASNVNFGLRVEHLTEDAGLVPAVYAAFLPESLDVEVGVPDINFEDLIDTGLKVVSASGEPISRSMLTRTIFPSGYGTVEFPRISARSGVYDVEASGELKASIQNRKSYSLQATIVARNFDATVAAVQDAAKANPRLNSVSFGLMAAKGFAKTDPDGRLRWDVTMDENRTVTVNGQIIKKP